MNLRDTLARKWFSQSEYLNKKTLNNDEKILLLSYKNPTIGTHIIPVLIISIELNHYFTVKHLLSAGFLTNIKTSIDKNKISYIILIGQLKIFKLLIRNYLNLNYIVFQDIFYRIYDFGFHDNTKKYETYTILSKMNYIAGKDHINIYYMEQRKKINYIRGYQLKYKYLWLAKFIIKN